MSPPSRGSSARLGLVATGLTLLALALVVGWGRWQLGRQMRSQIMGRDAVILQAMAARTAAEMAGEDPDFDLAAAEYQYGLLLNLANLTNIIAARLFGPDGRFVEAVPFEVKEAGLSDTTLAQMRQGEPVTRYRPSAPRQELFLALPDLEGVERTPCRGWRSTCRFTGPVMRRWSGWRSSWWRRSPWSGSSRGWTGS
ncbi:MAG: hypothetical protein M5U12_31405 [Verrucomicrobia bacterium]|nr:hypothetical protein [Verrucomicrobiota bacterium]